MKQQLYEEVLAKIKEEAFEGLRSENRMKALLNIYTLSNTALPKKDGWDGERAVIRGLLNGQ